MRKISIVAAGVFCFAAQWAQAQSFERQVSQIDRMLSDAARQMQQNLADSKALADTEQKKQFQNLLSELAQLSRSKPLQFQETSLNAPRRSAGYALTIDESADYKDAFFIRFASPDHSFSTLVAYEGVNGYIMGKLEVTATGDTTVYRHVFDGFLDDILTLTSVQGKITDLTYEKLNPQGVSFYSLVYKSDR